MKLPVVSTRYGAPMGRHSVPDLDTTRGSVRLFHAPLDSGGYDSGGAYWGHGGRLYCAVDREGDMQFTRANDRRHAALLLDIPAPALIRPFDWCAWCEQLRAAGVLDSDTINNYAAFCAVVESE